MSQLISFYFRETFTTLWLLLSSLFVVCKKTEFVNADNFRGKNGIRLCPYGHRRRLQCTEFVLSFRSLITYAPIFQYLCLQLSRR